MIGRLSKAMGLLLGLSLAEMSSADAQLPPLDDEQIADIRRRLENQKRFNQELEAEDMEKLSSQLRSQGQIQDH